jgi:hypothetical protein
MARAGDEKTFPGSLTPGGHGVPRRAGVRADLLEELAKRGDGQVEADAAFRLRSRHPVLEESSRHLREPIGVLDEEEGADALQLLERGGRHPGVQRARHPDRRPGMPAVELRRQDQARGRHSAELRVGEPVGPERPDPAKPPLRVLMQEAVVLDPGFGQPLHDIEAPPHESRREPGHGPVVGIQRPVGLEDGALEGDRLLDLAYIVELEEGSSRRQERTRSA